MGQTQSQHFTSLQNLNTTKIHVDMGLFFYYEQYEVSKEGKFSHFKQCLYVTTCQVTSYENYFTNLFIVLFINLFFY